MEMISLPALPAIREGQFADADDEEDLFDHHYHPVEQECTSDSSEEDDCADWDWENERGNSHK